MGEDATRLRGYYSHAPHPLPPKRPRRLRRVTFTRKLLRENRYATTDLPVFYEGSQRGRVTPCRRDRLSPIAAARGRGRVKLGIPVLALFPAMTRRSRR